MRAWVAVALALAVVACVHRADVTSLPAPKCEPGTLLFSLPELPLDLQLTPDAGQFLVVDPGGLALRNARTFAVERYLAPGVDGWSSVQLTSDGWRGSTVDGQHYSGDLEGKVFTRGFDSYVGREERETREQGLAESVRVDPADAQAKATEAVTELLSRYRVPAEVVPDLEATAYFVDRDRLWVATSDGVVRRIALAEKKQEAKFECAGCGSIVAITANDSLIVLVDSEERVIAYDPTGHVKYRSNLGAMGPHVVFSGMGLARKTVLTPEARLGWLTQASMGLLDLAANQSVSTVSRTGTEGTRGGVIWSADRIAVITSRGLQIIDVRSGTEVATVPGDFVGVSRLSSEELLLKGADGRESVYGGTSLLKSDGSTGSSTRGAAGFSSMPGSVETPRGPFWFYERGGVKRRGQLRSDAWMATDGTRLLLGSDGKGGAIPPGAVQLWCKPVHGGALIPPSTHPEGISVIDDVQEIPLSAIPEKLQSVSSEDSGAAWLLAGSELFRLEPHAVNVEPVKIPPPTEPWAQLAVRGDDVWLASSTGIARRDAHGNWKRWKLDGEGSVDSLQPFDGGAAVLRSSNGAFRIDVAQEGLDREHFDFPASRSVVMAELPDGVLVASADPKAPAAIRYRQRTWSATDPLAAAVKDLSPHGIWLRRGRVIVLAKTWLELDPTTGKKVSEVPVPVASKKHRKIVGPKPAPTPYLDSLDQELVRFLDRDGRPLFLAPMRGPAWLREYETVTAATDTQKGTWVLKADAALLFWDGKQVTAYFNPATRAARLAEME